MATRARRTLLKRIQAWLDEMPGRDPLDPLAPYHAEVRDLSVEEYSKIARRIRRVRVRLEVKFDNAPLEKAQAADKIRALTVPCRGCGVGIGVPCLYSYDVADSTQRHVETFANGEYHITRILDWGRHQRGEPLDKSVYPQFGDSNWRTRR